MFYNRLLTASWGVSHAATSMQLNNRITNNESDNKAIIDINIRHDDNFIYGRCSG